MAADFALPMFRSQDYDAFKRLLKDHLPATYEAWTFLHFKEVAEHTGRGHTVTEIEINPHEFARYCGSTNDAPNLKTLENFTTEKAARNDQ